MDTSILNSTKKILGLDPSYTAFDQDVITHINAVFSTLQQLGVGPATGFMIEDDDAIWGDFISDNISLLNLVKTYMYLRVRLIFDPPATSFTLDALNRQIQELEWRINVLREETGWSDPNAQEIVVEDETVVIRAIDGGVIR